MLYVQPLFFSASAALNTSLTARGIIPIVASVYKILFNRWTCGMRWTYRATLHGEGFSRTSLAICENTNVVSIYATLCEE